MKRFLIVIIVATTVLLAAFLAGLYSIGYFLSPQSALQKSDAIVAISGGDTAARTDEAVKLYKEGWAPTIIFSGAALDPNSPSNAAAMKRMAVAAGVPAGDILLDEVSANTAQNAADVAFIVKTHGFHKVILVTSPYHQRRASLTFRVALGKDIVILNHSTIDQTWRRNHWWATDYSRSLTWSELKKTVFVFAGGTATLP